MRILTIAAAAFAFSVTAPVAQAQSPSETLNAIFAEERAFMLQAEPIAATSEGVHDYDARLPSVTPDEQRRRVAADRQFLSRLESIDRAALSGQERISYDLFQFQLTQRVTLSAYRDWRRPFNSDSGFFSDVLFIGQVASPRSVRDYENYIARLNDLPRYFNEHIANMRQGMADGFTQPAAILPGVSRIIAGLQYARPEDSPLWAPFEDFPSSISEVDRVRLTAAGREAMTRAVAPAYRDFETFFETEYRPRARRAIGASSLPNGRAYYADLVRYFTTLPDVTPAQVHRTGLAEVARIRAEMEAIMRETSFDGDFSQFLTFLRTDPQFYATTPEHLLHQAAWISKEIEGQLPNYFGRLPRTPFTVLPVPAHLAPNYTGGRYNGGAVGAAGEYWVNTYALNTRPLYTLPSLTLHEAVPGHHTQGALSRELQDVPPFRREFYPHAFGEGWALYAEALGVEMGIYHTPYEQFGRLTYEMWRACRLVVDTGIHTQGWTRQQAIDYLAANTALSMHEITTEVDRYIAWPGQALAYKWGELKIWELRRRAEAALGDRFDIRGFHDAILANGGVTLGVLDMQIDTYIAAERAH
jgi:uncharacterized protein (DUF885 family)